MEIIYNWVITSMDEYPSTPENLKDVVFNINWRRNATTDVDNETYFADVYGSLAVPIPSPDNFTPYSELTFEQVCGWLQTYLDYQSIDAQLNKIIEQKIYPKIISLPLPWIS